MSVSDFPARAGFPACGTGTFRVFPGKSVPHRALASNVCKCPAQIRGIPFACDVGVADLAVLALTLQHRGSADSTRDVTGTASRAIRTDTKTAARSISEEVVAQSCE